MCGVSSSELVVVDYAASNVERALGVKSVYVSEFISGASHFVSRKQQISASKSIGRTPLVLIFRRIFTAIVERLSYGMPVCCQEFGHEMQGNGRSKVLNYKRVSNLIVAISSVNNKVIQGDRMGYSHPGSFIDPHRFIGEIDGCFGSSGAGICSLVTFCHFVKLSLHNSKLAMINEERNYSDSAKAKLTPQGRFFNPVNLPRQLLGFGLVLLGITVARFAHFRLLFGDRIGLSNRRALFIGIPGWGLAAFLIWHGTSLLL